MRNFIAVDGGGTKTDIVRFTEDGHILCRHVGPGGNPYDLGQEEALRRLSVCIEAVLACCSEPVAGIYGGMAGEIAYGDFFSPYVKERHPRIGHARFDDDGCNLISGTLGHRDGCGMVCGTGSSLFVRVEGQPLRHIGGKGYLIDTGGSGYELGQAAVKMALRSVDGRIGPTVLTELLPELLGMPVSDKIISVVHRGGRPFIASLARTVFAGRKLGDSVCQEIFDTQSALLADLTFAAKQYFPGDFDVVLGGGIAVHYPEYVEAIRSKAAPGARILLQQVPPIYGAAVEALWNAGIAAGETIRKNFLEDYACLTNTDS